jgi:hypothetical protein
VPEPTLRELQLDMIGFLTGAARENDAAHRLAVGDARLDGAGRLEIYANMYRVRLRGALEATAPMLARALGEDGFAELSLAYFTAHPSRTPSLRAVGEVLPAFLRARGQAGLADLAALEWARYDVFDAADEPLLELAPIQALGPEAIAQLPVRLIAASRLVPVAHAAEAAWRALNAGEAPDAPAPDPGTLLVWREDISVFHRRVNSVERAALEAATHGLPFASLCETLAGLVGDDPAPRLAGELLLRWVGDRMLVAG